METNDYEKEERSMKRIIRAGTALFVLLYVAMILAMIYGWSLGRQL